MSALRLAAERLAKPQAASGNYTMRLFLLDLIFSSARVKSFHYRMFHGACEKMRRHYVRLHEFDESAAEPIRIVRNGSFVPDVFQPSARLVVSEGVKDALAGVTNIAFHCVEFVKLVDCRYQAGDMWFYDSDEFRRWPSDTRQMLYMLPDDPRLHGRVGAYYELIVPLVSDILERNPTIKVGKVPILPPRDGLEAVDLSKELMSEFPIVWNDYHFFSESAFKRIAPFLDEDYFTTADVEI